MRDPMTEEIERARSAGRRLAGREARASSARYDAANRRIVVELTNGATFAFPPDLAEGLVAAADAALAEVEVLGEGHGLHWESLDVDFTVPGLLAGVLVAPQAWVAWRVKQVCGSNGLAADFGGKAAGAFCAAFAAVAAGLSEGRRYMDPIPNRDKTQLLITGTAVGSFGL